MGGVCSCITQMLNGSQDALNGDFRSEELMAITEAKKGGLFVNEEAEIDVLPLLRQGDVQMVTISDSSDGSFDQAVIDKLLAEEEEDE